MKDVLSEIITAKRKEVEQQKRKLPLKTIKDEIKTEKFNTLSFKEALQNSSSGIIAEFKRKSPSKGWINKDADAGKITQSYRENGAAALSVLTDAEFFGGSLRDLDFATGKTTIPVLRKEFIVDEYQIYQSKMFNVNAILLIAAAITPQECAQFTDLAQSLQMDVLLELHDERELDYITPQHNIIGINNRNLGSFVTDVQKSFKMIDFLPKEAVLVSESGISNPETVKELRQAGYKGFLIGENFMKTDDPGASLRKFISEIER